MTPRYSRRVMVERATFWTLALAFCVIVWRLLFLLVALVASGCVMVYAPGARNAAIQVHEQAATNLTNYSNVPVDYSPRLANELAGAVGVKGNVLSPSATTDVKIGKPR